MRKIYAILLIIALLLLAYFIYKVGFVRIGQGFYQVGSGFFILLGLVTAAFFVETWNWRRCIRRPPPFYHFLIPSWCGQSINLLTPGSSIGELVKGGLLKDILPLQKIVTSLILYNLAMAYSSMLIILIGSVGLWAIPFAPNFLRLAGTLLTLLMLCVLIVFHRGLLHLSISKLLGRIALRWKSSRLEKAKQHMQLWENEIVILNQERRWRFPSLVAVFLLSQAVQIFELWTTWLLLGVRLDLGRSLIFGGIDAMVQIVFMIVPGRLGVAEGTTYFASGALKLDAATGLIKQLIYRTVRLVFAIGGALVLLWKGVLKEQAQKKASPPE